MADLQVLNNLWSASGACYERQLSKLQDADIHSALLMLQPQTSMCFMWDFVGQANTK